MRNLGEDCLHECQQITTGYLNAARIQAGSISAINSRLCDQVGLAGGIENIRLQPHSNLLVTVDWREQLVLGVCSFGMASVTSVSCRVNGKRTTKLQEHLYVTNSQGDCLRGMDIPNTSGQFCISDAGSKGKFYGSAGIHWDSITHKRI